MSRSNLTALESAHYAYVWSSDDILKLRSKHRIVGGLVGSIPEFKQQNEVLGPPLQLSHEEVALLSNQGVLHLLKPPVPSACERPLYPAVAADSVSDDDSSIQEEWQPQRTQQPWELAAQAHDLQVMDVRPKDVEESDEFQLPDCPKKRLGCQVFEDLHSRGFYLTNGAKFGGEFLAYPGDPYLFHATFVVRVLADEHALDDEMLSAACRAATGAKKSLLLAWPEKMNQMTVIKYNTATCRTLSND